MQELANNPNPTWLDALLSKYSEEKVYTKDEDEDTYDSQVVGVFSLKFKAKKQLNLLS